MAALVNGTYISTNLIQNGRPVFGRWLGNRDLWLWYAPSKMWNVSNTSTKDANKAAGYAHSVERNLDDPSRAKSWRVGVGCGRAEEQGSVAVAPSAVAITAEAQTALSAALVSGDTQALAVACDLVKLYALETDIPQYEGARRRMVQIITEESKPIHIAGATQEWATRINGTFCPTTQVQNDRPVYAKEGDGDTWLYYALEQRWTVSSTESKDGNTTFSYAQSVETNLVDPALGKRWVVAVNRKLVEQGSVVIR